MSQDPQGHGNNGGAAEFLSIGAGKSVRVSEPGRGLSAQFAINCEPQHNQVTAFTLGPAKGRNSANLSLSPGEAAQVHAQSSHHSRADPCKGQKRGDPLPSPREGQHGCSPEESSEFCAHKSEDCFSLRVY